MNKNEEFEKCLSQYAATHTTGSTALLRKIGLHFFNARQPEIDAVQEQIGRHVASLAEWRGKVRELQTENAALQAEVEMLRSEIDRLSPKVAIDTSGTSTTTIRGPRFP
jgi:predicted RNase H-like nuclease (RuvC/YqgF family)